MRMRRKGLGQKRRREEGRGGAGNGCLGREGEARGSGARQGGEVVVGQEDEGGTGELGGLSLSKGLGAYVPSSMTLGAGVR